MKQRIFIGSSSEARKVAQAFADGLEDIHETTVWDEDIFTPSQSFLSSLLAQLDRSDAAVFVFAPDDFTRIRGESLSTTRDNVVFELGLFVGRLGAERTFYAIPKSAQNLHLPSDLAGIVAVKYDDAREEMGVSAVRRACGQINKALEESIRKAQKGEANTEMDPVTQGLIYMQQYVNKALLNNLSDRCARSHADDNVEEIEEGFRTKLDSVEVTVRFGTIQEYDAGNKQGCVALPATEFFDDDCIQDANSALGAFVQHAFAGDISRVQLWIKEELKDAESKFVARDRGVLMPSYGIAKAVYLKGAVAKGYHTIVVSVTTMRAEIGLRCEPANLFAAVKAICAEMGGKRLFDLYLPVMGSGHGGLDCKLALLYMLLAIRAVAEKTDIRVPRSVTIVVFQRDGQSKPSIEREMVRQIISLAHL